MKAYKTVTIVGALPLDRKQVFSWFRPTTNPEFYTSDIYYHAGSFERGNTVYRIMLNRALTEYVEEKYYAAKMSSVLDGVGAMIADEAYMRDKDVQLFASFVLDAVSNA